MAIDFSSYSVGHHVVGYPKTWPIPDLAVLQEQQRKGQRSQRWWKRFQEGQRQREGLEKLRHFEAFGYHLMRPGLRLTADPRNDGPGTLRSRKTGIVHGDFTLWSCPRLGFKEFLPEPLPFHHGFTIRLPSSKSPFLGLLFGFSISFYYHRFTSHSLHAGRTPSQARWGPGGSRRQVPVVSVGAQGTPPTSAPNSASSASLCFHAKLPAKLSSLTPGPQVL
jgi:hypothetical protein